MKRSWLTAATILLWALAGIAHAQDATVTCVGRTCGRNGVQQGTGRIVRDYLYVVHPTGTTFYELNAGTCDPNPADYTDWVYYRSQDQTNWTAMATWEGQLMNNDHDLQDHVPMTAHGQVSSPIKECAKAIRFRRVEGVEPGGWYYLLGYNNPKPPHDVAWNAYGPGESTDWSKPVGDGEGPVHGPIVPEPGTALLLGSGLIGLGGFAIRRRR